MQDNKIRRSVGDDFILGSNPVSPTKGLAVQMRLRRDPAPPLSSVDGNSIPTTTPTACTGPPADLWTRGALQLSKFDHRMRSRSLRRQDELHSFGPEHLPRVDAIHSERRAPHPG